MISEEKTLTINIETCGEAIFVLQRIFLTSSCERTWNYPQQQQQHFRLSNKKLRHLKTCTKITNRRSKSQYRKVKVEVNTKNKHIFS
jgi:hypothetical protein